MLLQWYSSGLLSSGMGRGVTGSIEWWSHIQHSLWTFRPRKTGPPRCLLTSGASHPMKWHPVSEELRPQAQTMLRRMIANELERIR